MPGVKNLMGFALILLAHLALGVDDAMAVEFTAPVVISATDTAYENQDIIVTGATITIDGAHHFNSLTLSDTSTLTQTAGAASPLDLTIATRVNIDATSRIDVSAKGGLANADVTNNCGGSYGSRGGLTYNGTTNAPYGDYQHPVDFGTGGDGDTRGGGAIKLVVPELILNGQILANGGVENWSFVGGGSGGAIWLDVGVLSGSGYIASNGGKPGRVMGGGGSGGRIAIYYTDASGFNFDTQVRNVGGTVVDLGDGYKSSGDPAGIYLKDKSAALGQIIFNSQASSYTDIHPNLDQSYEGQNIRVKGATLFVDGTHHFNSLTLSDNSTLTQTVGAASELDLTIATRVNIDATSRIDVTGKGGLAKANVTKNSGGSYGSRGGLSMYKGTTNAVYGDFQHPVDFGTGGEGDTSRGGGAVKLTVPELVLNGLMLANGAKGGGFSGGGSGGSIWLDVGLLSGSGRIAANGGNAGHYVGGGGSGGRIAIYYSGASGFDFDTQLMNFGGSGNYGQPGESAGVYLKNKSEAVGQLVFNNQAGPQTDIHPDFDRRYEGQTILIKNATLSVNGTHRFNTLTLKTKSVLTHDVDAAKKLVLTVKHLDIDVTSRIDVSAKGGLASASVTNYSGGSYGGSGGVYGSDTTNAVYGDAQQPVDFGTGGGRGSRGGGSVKLVVSDLVLNGEILANGEAGGVYAGGSAGGSGGSIWLDVGVLSGSGSVATSGGNAGPGYSGGGGGGRIAVYYNYSYLDLLKNVASLGGAGTEGKNGQPGTIYTVNKKAPVFVVSSSPQNLVKQDISAVTFDFSAEINEATFTLDDVSVMGPTGNITPTSLTKVSATRYTLHFVPALSTAGRYTIQLGPDIQTVQGLGMDQNQNATAGENPGDIYSTSIVLDNVAPDAPTVTNYVSSPEINRLTSTSVTLQGTRVTNSSIWVNGIQRVMAGSGNWSAQITLPQGVSNQVVTAQDAAGNASGSVTTKFFVDSIAPRITGATPANDSFINRLPTIELNVAETGSGIDINNSTLEVKRNNVVFYGDWTNRQNTLSFTPDMPFIDGTYSIHAQVNDSAGLLSKLFIRHFVFDRSIPLAPVLNGMPAVTNINSEMLSGSKDAYASIWLNGAQVVASSADTTWSYAATLVDGINTLKVTQRDRAGNESPVSTSTIRYDNNAPGPVSITTNGAGSGTDIVLDWRAYDEFANGNDIKQYAIYSNTVPYTQTSAATRVGTVSAGTKTFTVTGLTRNTVYYLSVVAIDSTNNSQTTVSPVSVTPRDTLAPEDVRHAQVSVQADAINVSWTPSVNSGGDLAHYKVYFNNDAGTLLADTVSEHTVAGLNPATRYPVRITAIDANGNESAGKSIDAITLLDNPAGLSSSPLSGMVRLSWNAVQPNQYVKNYAIYVSLAPFSNVETMTPALVVDRTATSAKIAGLTNNKQYYFAITAINSSNGEDKTVVSIPETPVADRTGPTLDSVLFNHVTLIDNATLTGNGYIEVTATDSGGVRYVEFHLDGALLSTDTNGSDGYKAYWNIINTKDGAHTLSIVAYDTYGNTTTRHIPLIIKLAAPAAPVISSPATGKVTNKNTITLRGTAEKQAHVQLYLNGAVAGSPIAVSDTGTFTGTVTIKEGNNTLEATATNRGGEGLRSSAIQVTLNTTLPDAPTGLAAISRKAGQVYLYWNKSAYAKITDYNIYRSEQPFTDLSAATKINTTVVTENSYTDLPVTDNTYYYRIVEVNTAGSSSALSNQVDAVSDNTPPSLVSMTFSPQGPHDSVTGRMAAGTVKVDLTVSEKLLTAPFVSINPNGGVPIPVNLERVSDTEYSGSFEILKTTPSGTASAVFSARDIVGNRGSSYDTTIKIDTAGPAIAALTLSPVEPIRNDTVSPVTINVALTLSEALGSNERPQLSYKLSAPGRSAVVIDSLTRTGTNKWYGSFILPADAGLAEVEYLSFVYQGVDDLGNISTSIRGANRFQVYQGDLPPLAIPAHLKAVALPGGQVKLTWDKVDNAAAYGIYRQAPGETKLTATQRITGVEYRDAPGIDGRYTYSIASIRQENGQEKISSQSLPVSVTADSNASPAPTGLTLSLTGVGIKASWAAPAGTDTLTYSLYRGTDPITDVSGLTPVRTGISKLTAIDATPSLTDHYYAVVAVDEAGNTSPLSPSVYLNFDLLPVATFNVTQTDKAKPILTWTHKGSSTRGYDLYLGAGDSRFKLNGNVPLTDTTYTDTGYSDNSRIYTIKALDAQGVESVGRSLLLPQLSAHLKAGTEIKRGIMNKIEYEVSNHSGTAVKDIQLQSVLENYKHLSAPFSLAAGESKTIPVVIGGYKDLPDTSVLTTRIIVTPNEGERVAIVRHQDVLVGDGALVLNIITQDLTRGGTGKVQFSLENTGKVEVEIILARGGAKGLSASGELRFQLVDADNNILSTQKVLQSTGANVVRLVDDTIVTRIPPGGTFTSKMFDLPVPARAPENVWVKFGLDRYHYHLGQPDHVAIRGRTTRRATTLVDTSYYGTLMKITPTRTFGGKDIVITGQAIDRATDTPMSSVPLKLVITVNGFERQFNVVTDTRGNFTYRFKPLATEAGVYKVSVIHPDLLDRPRQGSFTVERVVLNTTTADVNIPRDYDRVISTRATTGNGTTASNLLLKYEAMDQPGGSFPRGITVTPASPITLGSKESGKIGFTLRADSSADTSGTLYLRLVSDESGAAPLETIRVNYTLSQAVPVLKAEPSFIETGLSQGKSVSEHVTLSNIGLAPMKNMHVSLTNTDGSLAPDWIYLTVPQQQGTLAVGEQRPIALTVSAPPKQIDGSYEYRLLVTSSNHANETIPVYVEIAQSGKGGILFKTSDIYTSTDDANGKRIEGLKGARITVQNERVPSTIPPVLTDANGEALFSKLPAGWYKFRATALNHQELGGRFQIKAGLTANKEILLDYDLVTVQWAVTEITIQDKYEINLKATYETEVPAPVVVVEPSSVTLPDNMAPGDVIYGEFTFTNKGLIRADDFGLDPPSNDQYFKYEFFGSIPTSLKPNESVVVPYRVIALKPVNPDAVTGSGGGLGCYEIMGGFHFDYVCANGIRAGGGGGYGFAVKSVNPEFCLGGGVGSLTPGDWFPYGDGPEIPGCQPRCPSGMCGPGGRGRAGTQYHNNIIRRGVGKW